MALETDTEVATISGPAPLKDIEDNRINPAEANRQGNWGDGNDGSATDDTTGSSLPSNDVPDGVAVVVQAKHDNSGRVAVGLSSSPTLELAAGQSMTYQPTNTDQITIQANSAGDGVNFSHEQEA